MFKKNNDMNNNYFEALNMQKLMYEMEDINRKLRNLNNRLKRVEGFLGLNDDFKESNKNYND